MTLALIKPAGWAFGEILTSDQMEALDASQARAIDGTGGGTYAPSATIIISGSGLQVNNLTVTGVLSLTGNTTIGNSSSDLLTVNATSTFVNAVTINDNFTVNDVAEFNGDVTIGEFTFTVQGDAVLGNTAADSFLVNATAELNAPVTMNDTLDVYDDFTVHSGGNFRALGDGQIGNDSSKTLDLRSTIISVLAFASGGHARWATGSVPNSDTTLTPADGQVFKIDAHSSTTRIYSISASGAGDGDWMLFYTGSGSQGVMHGDAEINAGGDQFTAFNSGDGPNLYVLFVHQNGAWWRALNRDS